MCPPFGLVDFENDLSKYQPIEDCDMGIPTSLSK